VLLISAVGGEQLRATAESDRCALRSREFFDVHDIRARRTALSDTFLASMHLALITGDRFCADFVNLKQVLHFWRGKAHLKQAYFGVDNVAIETNNRLIVIIKICIVNKAIHPLLQP